MYVRAAPTEWMYQLANRILSSFSWGFNNTTFYNEKLPAFIKSDQFFDIQKSNKL